MPKGKIQNPAAQAGNPPADGRLIATHPDGWELYVYRTTTSRKDETWLNLKLISTVPRKPKGNYWLSYCLTRMDFGRTRDNLSLEGWDRTLQLWVERVVLADAAEGVETNVEDLL